MKKIITLAATVAALVFCTNCTKLEPSNINQSNPGKVMATINVTANNIPAGNVLVKIDVKDNETSKTATYFETTDAGGNITKEFPCVGYAGVFISASASLTQGTNKFSGSGSASAKMNQAVIITVKASAE